MGLPANPCLLTYSPDEPGLLPPSFKDVPGQGPIDWAVVGETTYEVILFGGSFIPGFDCLDAIVNGFAIANSSFCLADIFSGGLASSIPDAYKLATRTDEVVALVRGRNGDEVLRLRTRATKTISCALNSFPTGTQVRMADGTLRPIEMIEPGDSVLTANPETGEWSNQRVLDQWSHLDDGDMTTATFDDGSEITATDHHLFWVDNQGAWVRLEDVQSGDSLLTPEGVTTVDHVVTAGATSTLVWELDTQTTDTFTVNTGTADVVVHNADEVARNWVMVDSNWLKDLGIDAHQLKDDVGRDAQFDIFRDKNTGALGVGRKGLPPGSEVELLNMRVVNGVVEYVRC